MNKKSFVLPALFTVINSCNASVESNNVVLGDAVFCIPKRYDMLDQTTGSMFNINGVDTGSHVGSFQVSIPPNEVKKTMAEYLLGDGDLPASFIINVSLVPANQLEKSINSKYYADTLQLVSDYENAQIEYDEKNHFYRVSNWGNPPPFVLWEVLKMKPKKNAIIPERLSDYHVASCSNAGGTTGTNGTSSICDYSIKIGNYLVKIITTEINLKLKEKIITYAEKLLTSWKKRCD